jgi:hypothetical protein
VLDREVSGRERASPSTLIAPLRAWGHRSTFLGEVAVLFTVITVGNSVMMLTGLDEPKTGTFAYVHLLGRIAIVVVVVGLFHLGEARIRLHRWRDPAHRSTRAPRDVVEVAVGSVLRHWVEGTARVFTTAVVATCLTAVGVAGVRPPAGGVGLYRSLLLLAAFLLPAMFLASRCWHRRRP